MRLFRPFIDALWAFHDTLCILQWKDKARAAEAEVQKLQSQLAHVEHASRAQELTLDQLKGRLSDKVTREERLARRDAEAYARLKRAFLSNRGVPFLILVFWSPSVARCKVCARCVLSSGPNTKQNSIISLGIDEGLADVGCYLTTQQAAWPF